jgi:GNAT superfamily N-acetyltransferase
MTQETRNVVPTAGRWLAMTSGRSTSRIRVAVAADAPGILGCLAAAFRPFRRAYTSEAYVATVLTPTSLGRRLRSMTVWVALDARGRVVGTIALKQVTGAHGHLRGMAVLPSFQGRGVGRRLLAAAVRRARAGGTDRLTLETTEPLVRAERFYQRYGFRSTGHTRRWGGMRLFEFERVL